MHQLYLILTLLLSTKLCAQKERVLISGVINHDSIPVENIHIVNKSSQNGTISDKNGEFEILVKEGDLLFFSGIQFYAVELEISRTHIIDNYLPIDLFQRINTLEEVELKSHNLVGNLFVDIHKDKTVDANSKFNKSQLDFSQYDFSIASSSVSKQLDPDRLPNTTDPNIPIGGDLIGLASFILKPITKQIKKINKTKNELKIKEQEYKRNLKTAPEQIRNQFGDAFFTETLEIPADQIDRFIIHCNSKQIIELFLKDKKIEMINVFLEQKQNFKFE